MSERIVDEAFAAELAALRAGSADERFNRVLDLLKEIDSEKQAALSVVLLEIVRDQNVRIAELEEQLYRVYVKSGESIAQLKNDLGTGATAGSASSELLSNIREELKLLRGDIYARSGLQIQHIEERMNALEHDSHRLTESMDKRLSELEDRIEQTLSKSCDE